MPQEAETAPQASAASLLQADIILLQHRAASVNVLNPFAAYRQIKRISESQQQLSARLDVLHDQYRRSLNASLSGGGPLIEIYLTRIAGEGLSALMQVERSWQSLCSVVDQKRAYSFGFFSLYVAWISLIATVIFGIVSLK
jgi:hypothetical protein